MRRFVAALALILAAVTMARVGMVAAAGPEDDLRAANPIVERAITAAQSGDLTTAKREYGAYENVWFDIEDGVRAKSRDSYAAIEKRMSEVAAAFSAKNPAKDEVLAALRSLDREQKNFIQGLPPAVQAAATRGDQPSASSSPTVSSLVSILAATREAVRQSDYGTASAKFDSFDKTWVDVEGEIKTRSTADYRATESDMGRVSTLLGKQSADATIVLDGMIARLEPYESAGNYRVFDATIIVLREGLEALLVVVALLAFLKRSDNSDKDVWVWSGAGVGIAGSLALGVGVHELFGRAFSGGHRELLEGITGLVAAGMLLYVSYWLHSQSSIGAWQRYIRERTTAALATGSLMGLGTLAFLAVFREGGETVLFLIGMTGKIATGDLLLGLGIGFAGLAVVGVLLTVVGVRIPMRPFFAVASVLTFYLCFKFVGTGLHSLQVAGVLSAGNATGFPESDTLGLFPTWQTTIPQAVLLLTGLAIFFRTRLRDRTARAAVANASEQLREERRAQEAGNESVR